MGLFDTGKDEELVDAETELCIRTRAESCTGNEVLLMVVALVLVLLPSAYLWGNGLCSTDNNSAGV